MAKTAKSTFQASEHSDGERAKALLDARLDEALEETFPASDPVAISPAPADAAETRPTVLRDNVAARRFELDRDGATAIAHYRLSPGTITVTHTETPAHLRGRGIGSVLVAQVLDEVRRRGLKVVPQCPFVADFIGRHHEYHDLLA